MTITQTKLHHVLLGALIIAGLFAVTTSAEATSGATRATMIEVNATTTAYVITYEFGFLNRTTLMPAIAMQSTGKAPVTTHPPLTYSYRTETGATTTVPLTAAVVWSTATQTDSVFTVRDGKRERFSLITIATHAADARPDHLTIDTLPFTLIDSENTEKLSQLTKPEMARFTTAHVDESSYISTPIPE